MKRNTVLALAAAFVLGLAAGTAYAQEKLEGKVVSTKLTACDFKPGGCEGSMVLEVEAGGKTEQATIKVQRGVLIKHGSENLFLPALRGSVVSVSYVTEKGEKVAKSIDVVKKSSR